MNQITAGDFYTRATRQENPELMQASSEGVLAAIATLREIVDDARGVYGPKERMDAAGLLANIHALLTR